MSCRRCLAGPQPQHFGAKRCCAFDVDGAFTPVNWNCATLRGLVEPLDPHDGSDLAHAARLYGHDETIEVVPAVYIADGDDIETHNGWIVLTRYKRRGCCSSAVHVGDFYPAKPVTLALVEATLAARERNAR